MKKLLLGTAMSLAMVASASAADMYVKAAPPAFSWTGCYLGVAGGAAWGQSNQSTNAVTPVTITGDFNVSGAIFGGTVGCNYQVAPSFVIGIEDDISWTNKKGSVNDIPPGNTAFTSETHEKWIDTLRGRIGFVVPGGTLLYATGGGAFASYGITVCPPAPAACASEDQTRTGWTAGGGVEFWIPGTKLSAKAEYLYVNFKSTAFFNPSPGPAFLDRAGGVKLNDNIVRAGLNWHF